MSSPENVAPTGGELPIRLNSESGMTDRAQTSNSTDTTQAPNTAVGSFRTMNGDSQSPNEVPRHVTVEDGDADEAEHVHSPAATTHQADDTQKMEGAEASQNGEGDERMPMQMETKKKKKKKSSAKKKKGENAPCGFEEYYVDPPMTPEEFAEEKKIYNPKIPFANRIQTAIQRYTARRKFSPERSQIWTMYLRYGGVDPGPKMFGGVGNKYEHQVDEEDQHGDAETLKAKEFVSDDVFEDQLDAEEDEEASKYVVDFDGVIRGFFSMQLPGAMPMGSLDKIKLYTGVIRNWLNWLIHHNVCVEYNDQIQSARRTCDVATRELWHLCNLGLLFPDKFNKACRTMFTSESNTTTTNNSASNQINWGWENDGWGVHDDMDRKEASRIFLTGLAALGDDALVDRYQECNDSDEGIFVTRSFTTGLEVVAVNMPSKSSRATYADDVAHGLSPLGTIRARSWHMDWELLPDMTEEEEATLSAKRAAEQREFTFWVDEAALKHVFVGLKLVAGVKELNFGFTFLASIAHSYTSFVTWLPNELMVGYRKHEYIPPNREKLLSKLGIEEGEGGGEVGEGEGEGGQDQVQ